MKKKNIIKTLITMLVLSSSLVILSGCGDEDPVDEACDAVENMAQQKDRTQEALDEFHSDADAKESEADAILDGILE